MKQGMWSVRVKYNRCTGKRQCDACSRDPNAKPHGPYSELRRRDPLRTGSVIQGVYLGNILINEEMLAKINREFGGRWKDAPTRAEVIQAISKLIPEPQVERIVVWFSAGVASAIAAKIAVEKYRGVLPVHLVNCDTGSEHEDNFRFADDISNWLQIAVEFIRNPKYQNTTDVYRASGYFKNHHGAKCTFELKRLPRQRYQNLKTDLQIFGYAADEKERADLFRKNNPEVRAWFPLIEQGITKATARLMVAAEGIKEPITYSLGFKNANCLATGCIKGGLGYWNHVRKVMPEVFWRMARLEREIGYALNQKAVKKKGKWVKVALFLDELSEDDGNYKAEAPIQCGLACGEY